MVPGQIARAEEGGAPVTNIQQIIFDAGMVITDFFLPVVGLGLVFTAALILLVWRRSSQRPTRTK